LNRNETGERPLGFGGLAPGTPLRERPSLDAQGASVMDSDVAWHSRCARSGNVRPVGSLPPARAPSLTLLLTHDEGPTQDGRYTKIAVGADGNLWFTESSSSKVG
jgi:hypothetical protein